MNKASFIILQKVANTFEKSNKMSKCYRTHIKLQMFSHGNSNLLVTQSQIQLGKNA